MEFMTKLVTTIKLLLFCLYKNKSIIEELGF